jgi:predicted MFS family arabinose efflux permease
VRNSEQSTWGAAPSKAFVLPVLLALLFMYQADATIVNVALPAIEDDLGARGAAAQLVIGGYLLASASLLITGARLGQMLGYRDVFLTGVAVFGLASLACGLADDAAVLIAARVVQGVGGALAFPQVLSAIQTYFDEGVERTRALGSYSVALTAGAVTGQILGGVLVSANLFGLGWRPIFFVNVPIAAAVILVGLRHLPPGVRSDPAQSLDGPGVLALAGTVLLLVVPVSLGRELGWPAWTWVSLIASCPTFLAFLAVERRAAGSTRRPLVDLDLVRKPAIAWGLLAQCLAVATYYGLLFTVAQYLQQGMGLSALASGLTLLPWVVAFAVPGRTMARVPAGLRPLLPAAGCLTLAGAYATISIAMLGGGLSEAALCAILAVGGLGLGTTFASILVHLTTVATPRRAADISGVFTSSLQIAGTIGVAAFGTLYLGRLAGPTTAAAARHAFGITTAAFALVALVAAGAALQPRRASAATTAPSPRR